MATSRRSFLKRGSLVALAAGVPLSVAESVAGKALSDRDNSGFHLTKSAFEAQLNSNFEIGTRPSIKVSLTEVKDLPNRSTSKDKEGFTLRFRATSAPKLKQDTYVINHQKLGTFSLLLVPMDRTEDRAAHYEAVINRLYP